MHDVDELLRRNRDYAETRHQDAAIDLAPTMGMIVIACCDHRADPSHVLGIGPGEAVVIRNAGGRLTPDVLNTLMVLATVAIVEGVAIGDLRFVILHHTDCGTGRLAGDDHRGLAAQVLGIEPADVPGRHLGEPDKAVAVDVGLLRSDPRIPATASVTGLVYDIETAELRVVA